MIGIYIYSFLTKDYYLYKTLNSTQENTNSVLQQIKDYLNLQRTLENSRFELPNQQTTFYCKVTASQDCCFVIQHKNQNVQESQNLLDIIIEYCMKHTNKLQLSNNAIEEKFKMQLLEIIQTKKMPKIINEKNVQNNCRIYQENMSSISSQQRINSGPLLVSKNLIEIDEEYLKVFRCFLMYDYQRQFFYMFIRLGFQLDKAWSQERQNLQLKLMEQIKKPADMFEYVGDFGRFRCKYDKKQKCYFCLLCRFHSEVEKQDNLLQELYDAVVKIPKYTTLRYDILEGKKKRELQEIIGKHERQYQKDNVNAEFLSLNKFEKALGKAYAKSVNQSQISIKRGSSKNSSILQTSYIKENPKHLDEIEEYELNIQDYYEPGEVAQRVRLYSCKELKFKSHSTIQDTQDMK